MNWEAVIYFAIGLALLYLIGKLLLSMKWLLRLLFNSILCGAALALLNLILAQFSIGLAMAPVNAMIVGLLSLPGVLLFFLIRLILL